MKKSIIIAMSLLLQANELNVGEIEVIDTNLNHSFNSSFLSTKEYNFKDSKTQRIDESIKQNSNISFNLNDNISTNVSSISPKDFSINAAAFYQNSFLINGASFDNIINPLGDKNINAFSLWQAPVLGSLASSINTSLLKSIDVYDSNVSAKYGNFEGGVIDAQLKDPSKKFAASIFTSYTDGNLSKIIIDENKKNDYENSFGKNLNKNFVKQNYNIYLESKINDNYGFLFNYSKSISKIKMPTKKTVLKENYFYPNQSRKNENFLLKAFLAFDNHILKPSIIYAPSVYTGFLEGVIDSNLKAKFGGIISNLELFSEYDNFSLSHSLSYSLLENARYFDKNIKIAFFTNDVANWGTRIYSSKGGYSDIKESTKELNYKLDFESAYILKNLEHNLIAGLQIKYKKASYNALKELREYYNPKIIANDYTCKSDDMFCLMGDVTDRQGNKAKGQYVAGLTFTPIFKESISANDFDFYLEDEMKYKRLNLRLGARASYDALINKFNIAPRTVAEFDMLKDESNFLGAGYNRYYGKSFFAYKLYDAIYSRTQFFSRNSPDEDFKATGFVKDRYNFKDLKRPYNDEFSIFYRAQINNINLAFKYIKRLAKNQVVLSDKESLALDDLNDERLTSNYKVYTNYGKSKADIFSFDIANINSIKLLNLLNDFSLSASYTNKKSNFKDYKSDERQRNTKVKYNNQIILSKDLPIIDYYDKCKIVFMHNLKLMQYDLNFTNLLTFIPNKKALISTYNKIEAIKEYELIKLNDYFTWDINISYKHKIKNNIEFFSNINIENLLNTKNKINASKVNNQLSYDYAMGRNIMFEFGLNY